MALPSDKDPSNSPMETVEKNIKIYKSLLLRPSIEEIESSISIIKIANSEDGNRIEELSNQAIPEEVRSEPFEFQIYRHRKDTTSLFEFQNNIERSDEPISRDNTQLEIKCNPNSNSSDFEIGGNCSENDKISIGNEVEDNNKLSLVKIAAIIEEDYTKSEVKVLDLQAKLMERVEWLPLSIGNLINLIELNLSNNHIMAVPSTISNLNAIEILDFHSNQIINLPCSFGELLSLTRLNLHGNRLRKLPLSFGNLVNLLDLDLSSNRLTYLPDVIGDLKSLKKLNVENNELEELTYMIGSCSLLVDLRLDFNRLKSLPETMENLGFLEILTVRYNRIKKMDLKMGKLLHLQELDVSFNELEELSESLCFASNLKKLNVGKNFVDLKCLPDSIGNLEMLEELDISDNQIRKLPDSFRFLVKLKVLHVDIDLLQIPPSHIAELGPEAIVQYMDDFVDRKGMKKLIKTRGHCFLFGCCFGIEI